MSKSCPNPCCPFIFTKKTKPANNLCPQCHALIGELGVTASKPKKDPNKNPIQESTQQRILLRGSFL